MAAPFQPHPLTPLITPWGEAASHIVRLVNTAPDLAPRLLLLPRRGLHAVAIALQVADAEGERDDWTVERIRHTNPRALLRHALPEAVQHLYSTLDRAATPAWPLASYRRLNEVLRSPAASTLPSESEITREAVRAAHDLLSADPIVWRARNAYSYSHTRDHVATVVEILRALGVLDDLARLPDGSGKRAIQRRVQADLARAEAPLDGFPTVEGWRRVTSVGDLWSLGKRLNNCVTPGGWEGAGSAVALVRGRRVYLHHETYNYLAEVRHLVRHVWSLTQIAGPGNAGVPRPVRDALATTLRESGLVIVAYEAADAFQQLLRLRDDGGLDGDEEGLVAVV